MDQEQLLEGMAACVIGAMVMLVVAFGSCRVEAQERSTLEDRVMAWVEGRPDGAHRLRKRGSRDTIIRVSRLVSEATKEGAPSPELAIAVGWRESRLRPQVRGKLGEHGVFQVHPNMLRAAGLRPGEDPLDLATNVRLGVGWLRRAIENCDGDIGRGLRAYAAGGCYAPTWSERIVMRWAQELSAASPAALQAPTGSLVAH